MNQKTLTSYYPHLKAEERFRLILAASGRGDEAERDRLSDASPRIILSMPDHSPYGHAMQDLALLAFIELTEETAKLADAYDQWTDEEMLTLTDARTEVDGDGESNPLTTNGNNRAFDLFLAQEFVLRTKVAGWRIFCELQSLLPFDLWRGLPGFDRLMGAIKTAEGTQDWLGSAFHPEAMAEWLNRVRPEGTPEVTESAMMTPEKVADAMECTFRDRVTWWGG